MISQIIIIIIINVSCQLSLWILKEDPNEQGLSVHAQVRHKTKTKRKNKIFKCPKQNFLDQHLKSKHLKWNRVNYNHTTQLIIINVLCQLSPSIFKKTKLNRASSCEHGSDRTEKLIEKIQSYFSLDTQVCTPSLEGRQLQNARTGVQASAILNRLKFVDYI